MMANTRWHVDATDMDDGTRRTGSSVPEQGSSLGKKQGAELDKNNELLQQRMKELLQRRVKAWIDLGKEELSDCRKFHERIGDTRWHREAPPAELQKTWRPLMLLLMTFLDKPAKKEHLRDYQCCRWGMVRENGGETS